MGFEKGDILRWFYGRIFGRPMNFSFIDEHVAGSAGPLQKKEVDWMREKKGISAILTLREAPLVPAWVEGLRYLNVPIRNHVSPTLDQVRECVNFIMIETESGKKANVHCAAGMGRTGTVLAAYLCKKYEKTADEAIEEVRAKRRGSIEKKQEKVIQEYYTELRNLRKS